MEVSVLELLERALNQTGAVIATISPAQKTLPTPCTDWDVESLVKHLLTHDLPNFTASARGETPDWASHRGELSEDWSQQFRQGAELLMGIWKAADLDRQIPTPGGGQAPLRARADHQIAELAMHSWDLAKGLGAEIDLDPALAEYSVAWSKRMLKPEFRGAGKAFGAEVPVPPDAPAYDRLAGWFGRDPDFT